MPPSITSRSLLSPPRPAGNRHQQLAAAFLARHVSSVTAVHRDIPETVAAGENSSPARRGRPDQGQTRARRSTGKADRTRTIDIAYEITIENHRPNKARVSVHDHIPVSTNGDIKVRLRETSPNPAEQNDLGELTWELSLEDGQAATIRHRFTIEHPAQMIIAGL
jgi:hypothetical protein